MPFFCEHVFFFNSPKGLLKLKPIIPSHQIIHELVLVVHPAGRVTNSLTGRASGSCMEKQRKMIRQKEVRKLTAVVLQPGIKLGGPLLICCVVGSARRFCLILENKKRASNFKNLLTLHRCEPPGSPMSASNMINHPAQSSSSIGY
jgi:hypothetical protein